jgi:DNA polymerase beta
MSKKELIISNLESLKKTYLHDESKKWNLKALSSAINSIKKYDGEILNGAQLEKDIKGVGEKISKRIDEILETGTLKELNNMTDTTQSDHIENLLLITGVGPARAKKWLAEGIKNIDDIREAQKTNKITVTHHIDIGIKYYEDFQKMIPRDEIDIMKDIIETTIKRIDSKLIFEICGSYRRGLAQSGDIDILVSHPNHLVNISEQKFLEKIVKELTKKKFIIGNLTSKGNTKFMGVCKINDDSSSYARRIDIRVIDYSAYYTSLLYFTGSKNFNLYLRNKALENNYTLNEYSLTELTTNKSYLLKSEEEIFDILKIPYLSPKDRNS